MANTYGRKTGDDQLVYGMPKQMHASVNLATGETTEYGTNNAGMKTYWRYHPKPGACDKCQVMPGVLFEERPGPVHPNCKCEIEQIATNREISGRTDIIVPPGVDIAANIAEARRVARACEERAKEYIGRLPPNTISRPSIPFVAFVLKAHWIIKMFKSGVPYDFKSHFGKEGKKYEAFGNYHYGLYLKAMGFSNIVGQVGAGVYQILSGTSKWSYSDSWYDDPLDQKAIRKGQRFPLK